MNEPSGLANANDSNSRDTLGGPAGPPGGAAAGAGPDAAIRPFLGFDRERAAYARLKPILLAEAEGRFIAILGDDYAGPVATFGDAEGAGYRRFGLGPLYIKQLLVEEPVQTVSRDIRACRS